MTIPSPIFCDSSVSLRALTHQLRYSNVEFRRIARSAPKSYREIPQKKKNGLVRIVFEPTDALKRLQKAIDSRLLKRIPLPDYVQGGVKGRSSLTNATQHKGQRNLVRVDIHSFFDKITTRHIYAVWHDRLGFCAELATWLTRITTYRGTLPPGSPASTSLANLVLIDVDLALVAEAETKGLVYTRYVDDLAISGAYPQASIGTAVRQLQRIGLRSSKSKLTIMNRGHVKGQAITGYVLNNGVPSVARSTRDKVRAAIHRLQFLQPGSNEHERLRARVVGQVNYIRATNPTSADRLEEQLRKSIDHSFLF